MIEVPLAMVAWVSVVLFQAIVHFGIIKRRHSGTPVENDSDGEEEEDDDDDDNNNAELLLGEETATNTSSSTTIRPAEASSLDERLENELNNHDNANEEQNDDDDNGRGMENEEGDEPEIFRDWLSQTGSELVGSFRSTSFIERRASEQLLKDDILSSGSVEDSLFFG